MTPCVSIAKHMGPADPLTETIELLSPQGLLWKQMDASGSWGVAFPANDAIVFCLIAEGEAFFQAPDGSSSRLHAGDFVIMLAPDAWSLRSDTRVAATPMDELLQVQSMHGGFEPVQLGESSGGTITRIVGGAFAYDRTNAGLVRSLLPSCAMVSTTRADATRVRTVLDYLSDEALDQRPGRTLALERLLQLLLLEVLRHSARPATATQPGLLAGLADRRIGAALRALHADVERRWTVSELASVASMSRSVFSDRFTRTIGQSPIDYLLRWRMARAKEALRLGNSALAEVAAQSGYSSASAFSIAFTREVGCPPGRFARGGDC